MRGQQSGISGQVHQRLSDNLVKSVCRNYRIMALDKLEKA